MHLSIPEPASGGLILSYKCNSRCQHCMYACEPDWNPNWISEEQLENTLDQIADKIQPAPYGPKTISPNHGLHITGGEPFLNYDLLSLAIEKAASKGIPSLFVESNCSWCTDEQAALDKLRNLKSKGLEGILISVNPFYLEYTPFENTKRCIRASKEVFGRNVMIYQRAYYHRFKELGIKETVPFENYVQMKKSDYVLNNVEFFMMGRAPYEIPQTLDVFTKKSACKYFDTPCTPSFGRKWHNHFDNYGNYIPGYCGGISLGKIENLNQILEEGINTAQKPILGYLLRNDFKGLFEFAENYGFKEDPKGYYSKCHLCMEVRKYLNRKGKFDELSPDEYYEHLNS